MDHNNSEDEDKKSDEEKDSNEDHTTLSESPSKCYSLVEDADNHPNTRGFSELIVNSNKIHVDKKRYLSTSVDTMTISVRSRQMK